MTTMETGESESETAMIAEAAAPAPADLAATLADVAVSGEFTGSVISTMTEQELLESYSAPAVLAGSPETSVVDSDVPSQVILSSEQRQQQHTPAVSGAVLQVILPETGSENPPLILNIPTNSSTGDTVSCPAIALSGPESSLEVGAPLNTQPHEHSLSTPLTNDTSSTREIDNHLDDYIRSPEIQNAIVERSPGGRYVRFLEKLGSGASKDVYRAYDTQEGIEVAWNVVNLSGVPKSERNRIVNEVRLLERLHHHNIISFHGSWVNRERQEVNFVTEILSSGTLKSFINKVQLIRWKIAKRWATQILNGLEYLHSQDPPVIHRDLKAENIFINGTSGDLRIGDLGLSTVHRNGRVLSVLGTPEFMAPDMYEDGSYDVKVDIYAFGMVLLEIFTKEIPYSECMNPAQIYKKVSAGEPPEVLKRLESRHAREFVKLCLGYKDEAGNFIRPSATELLQHPFLEIRESHDDEEVLVRPSLRETTISEAGETSSATSPVVTPSKRRPSASDVSRGTVQLDSDQTEPMNRPNTPPPQSLPRPLQPVQHEDDDDGDRFQEMPESETNMKRVKVLMGRGHELEDNSHDFKPESAANSVDGKFLAMNSVLTCDVAEPDFSPEKPMENRQYLVAAAMVGPLDPDTRPYPDDNLKLVVTLPVDGQTQNVQFDFHLIEDDPVQVAKEMVLELDIPTGAILEISQTISGLARTARMQVESFNVRSSNGGRATSVSAPSSTVGLQTNAPATTPQFQANGQHVHAGLTRQAPHQTEIPSVYAPPASDIPGHFPSPGSHALPVQSHPTIPQSHGGGASLGVENHLPHQSLQAQMPQLMPQNVGMPRQQQAHASMYAQHHALQQQSTLIHHFAPSPMPHSAPLQQMQNQVQLHQLQASHLSMQVQSNAPQQAHVQQQASAHLPPAPSPAQQPPMHQIHHSTSQQQLQQQQSVYPASEAHFRPLQQQQQQHVPQHITIQGQQQGSMQLPLPTPYIVQSPYIQAIESQTISTGVPPVADSQSLQQVSHDQATHTAEVESQNVGQSSEPISGSDDGANVVISTLERQVRAPAVQSLGHVDGSNLRTMPAPAQQNLRPVEDLSTSFGEGLFDRFAKVESSGKDPPPKIVERSGTAGSQMDSTLASTSSLVGFTVPVSADGSVDVDSDSDGSDSETDEEIRKLEEDYKKNVQRTRKVFDSRMESLQRTLSEKETLHQKALEKHEKEKYEFERRLAQEEEQQSRRLEQLQKEWEKKRDELAESRRRELEKPVSGQNQQLSGQTAARKSSDTMRTTASDAEPGLSAEHGGIRGTQTQPER